jgi:hypothetical protein
MAARSQGRRRGVDKGKRSGGDPIRTSKANSHCTFKVRVSSRDVLPRMPSLSVKCKIKKMVHILGFEPMPLKK